MRRCIHCHERAGRWHLGRKLIVAKNSKKEDVCEPCVYEEEDSDNLRKNVDEVRSGEA